jgi:hypothetical protein
VAKPNYIDDVELRQNALEDEIARAQLHCSSNDLMQGTLG